MPEYIEREKAYELARTSELYSDFHRSMADLTSLKELLEDTPTADVVPSAVLEQVMWERDMALETLKEHGIGFCEKSDMVEIDKIAELLDELFGNECPCNFNNFDEWLPYVCEYRHTCDCATKEGWKQLILAKMDGKGD